MALSYSFPDLEPVGCSCPVLTVPSWPAYTFSGGWWDGLVFPSVYYSRLIVIHKVKDFGLVNKAEVDVFLELACFFCGPKDGGNLISGASAFYKFTLNIWKFSVHVVLMSSLENFEHYLARVWVKLCDNLNILSHCPSSGLEWKWTFSRPVATAEFSKFAGILSAALS